MILEWFFALLFIVGGLALMVSVGTKRLTASKTRLIIGALLLVSGVFGIIYIVNGQGGPFDFLAAVLAVIGRLFNGLAEVIGGLTDGLA